MSGHSIEQEEVITRLTEIYHQLEEVESLLNSNILEKKDWQIRSAAKLRNLNHRISVMERNRIFDENKCVQDKAIGLEYQKKLKLTLGY